MNTSEAIDAEKNVAERAVETLPGDESAAATEPGVAESKVDDSAAEGKPKPKKKRKSPAVPWKKPADMPKRPLSAYNLYFRQRREELINVNAGPKGKPAADESTGEGQQSGKSISKGTRKHKKTCGIGFANLAKTIAAEWKILTSEQKEPFEKDAAVEKQKYDAAIVVWRAKQKQKSAPDEHVIPPSEQHPRGTSSSPLSISSNHSIASFADPYPPEWFDVSMNIPETPTLSPMRRGVFQPEAVTDDSSRNFEESQTTLGSSMRSLEAPQTMYTYDQSPVRPDHHFYPSGRFYASQMAERLHPQAFEPPFAQPHTMAPPQYSGGSHEFARALSTQPQQGNFEMPTRFFQHASGADWMNQAPQMTFSNVQQTMDPNANTTAGMPGMSSFPMYREQPSTLSSMWDPITAQQQPFASPNIPMAPSSSLQHVLRSPHFASGRSGMPQRQSMPFDPSFAPIPEPPFAGTHAPPARRQSAPTPADSSNAPNNLGERLDDDTIDFITGHPFS